MGRGKFERCETAEDLHVWIDRWLGMNVPRKSVCPDHQAPFDYVWAAYNDESDLVVWAPRGGGKTTLGALASFLDLTHKPGCQVRILGGSMEQSLRMWEQLFPMLNKSAKGKIKGKARARQVKLTNGSAVAVLAQSQTSVRGQRVQRLRCDEVDLFDEEVWEAAQLVTRSKEGEGAGGAGGIKASLEAFSTMHTPSGLMSRIVEEAPLAGRKVIKWCLLDVLEKCTRGSCRGCVLEEDCQGKARMAEGFVKIDDAIRMKRRVCKETWEAEMLCRRPSRRRAVFPEFEETIHVSASDPWGGNMAGVHRTLGVDFGFADPFVCLWIMHDANGRVYVMDEYVKTMRVVQEHAREMGRHSGFRVVCCDPAGSSQNSQTARSDVSVLERAGFSVRWQRTRILDGINAIRTALGPAEGEAMLTIHPRCQRLIASMKDYQLKEGSEEPHKDKVNDHAVDALRYFYVNRPSGQAVALAY